MYHKSDGGRRTLRPEQGSAGPIGHHRQRHQLVSGWIGRSPPGKTRQIVLRRQNGALMAEQMGRQWSVSTRRGPLLGRLWRTDGQPGTRSRWAVHRAAQPELWRRGDVTSWPQCTDFPLFCFVFSLLKECQGQYDSSGKQLEKKRKISAV